MLLAITNQISLEVAVIPFLWMLPLALYLLSFILCFEYERSYHRGVWLPLLGLSGGAVAAALLIGVHVPMAGQLAIYLVALMAYCMVCHGELVRRKPGPRYLTSFYLTVSAGGALGGIFTGIIAPTCFLGLWELPLALVAGIALALVVVDRDPALGLRRRRGARGIFGAIGLYLAGLCGALGYHAWYEYADNVFVDRGFFGTLRIDLNAGRESGPYLRLRHGRIIHGIQFVDEDLRRRPNSYYGPKSGVGLGVLHRRGGEGRAIHLGVIGLGTGTIAAYGEAGDRLRFYEIDPDVLALSAGDDPFFTYLRDTPAEVTTVLGDARLSLEREEDQGFDVLVVDAFSSDSIPAHLITVEAIELYLRHLAPDGIIALHISNRYLDLDPLARGLAEALDLAVIHVGDYRDGDRIWPSDWMLLSRDRSILDEDTPIDKAATPESEESLARARPLWTDASSNLLEVLKL
ncbi:MAG: fused MFS/spermidine synthase, partial [Myxococcales bacterium]|nr:fused MFS/spermidine synthase [Myxococcales bacterium]